MVAKNRMQERFPGGISRSGTNLKHSQQYDSCDKKGKTLNTYSFHYKSSFLICSNGRNLTGLAFMSKIIGIKQRNCSELCVLNRIGRTNVGMTI
jgi:hypothetical protein